MNDLQFLIDIRKHYGYTIQKKIIAKLKHVHIQRDAIIYKIKDKATRLHILLNGKIAVYMQTLDDDNLQKVSELNPICSFGEIALQSSKMRRNQTLIAMQDCELAELDRSEYLSVLGDYQTDLQNNKIKLLSSLGCFDSWTHGQFKSFSAYLHPIYLVLNEVVYKEAHPSNAIFLIKEGTFEMIKRFKKDTDLPNQKQYESKILCIINEGQVVGEECFTYGQDIFIETPSLQARECEDRYSTLRCISQYGTVYRIKKHDIEERLWDEITREQFNKIMRNINLFHQRRIDNLTKRNIVQVQQVHSEPEQLVRKSTKLELITELPQLRKVSKHQIPSAVQTTVNRQNIYTMKNLFSRYQVEIIPPESPKRRPSKSFHIQLSQRFQKHRTEKSSEHHPLLGQFNFEQPIYKNRFMVNSQIKTSLKHLSIL